MWLLQCDKRATVCFCAWSCAFFCICRCVFYTQKCHMLVCTSVFSCHFFFFFLRRQCAACTHERKGNIVCSASLYSGTYQLKGCCLDSLRWGYSVKKQAIQMSEHWGKFFTTHLITENITAEGWVGGTSRGLYCGFLFFFILLQFTHISCSAIFLIFLVISHTQACYLPFHPSITTIIHTRLEHIAQPEIKFKKNIIEICYVTFVRDLQYINTYAPIIMYNVEKRLTELYSVC